METLTKREEEIMMIIWRIKKGLVHDFINEMPEPHPPYNTISSIVRILEKKGFVGHKAYGKTHEYFATITKMAYRKHIFKSVIQNYFENSYENVVSYLVNEKEMSNAEMEEINKMIDVAEQKKI